jgi:actin, other eukaryote
MSVWAKRAILTIKYPVEAGHVTNWDDWEKLLHTLFYNELRRAPEEHPCVMLLPPQLSAANRSKVVMIMFETFNVPALRLLKSDEAAAYPSRDTIVVASGFDSTVISVVRGGLSQSFIELPVGGKHITILFEQLLNRKHDPLVEEIKAKLCFVSPVSISIMRAMWIAEGTPCILPDSITLNDEIFEYPESVFFGPNSGLIEGIIKTVLESGLNDIVLVGKNTLFPGLVERLSLECLSRGTRIKIRADADRGMSAWKHASLLSSHNAFNWILKDYYDEHGPDVAEQQQAATPASAS